GPISVWEVATSQRKQVLSRYDGWISELLLSADGKTVVSNDRAWGQNVWIWQPIEAKEPRQVLKSTHSGSGPVALAPDGKALAISGVAGSGIEVHPVAS